MEKQFCKREVFKTPDDHYQIMERHGKVKRLNADWKVWDYKTLASRIFKAGTIPIQASKVWHFKKNEHSVSMQRTDTGPLKQFDPLKKNVKLCVQKPGLVPQKSRVADAKKKDFRKLLSFLNLTAEEAKFYDNNLK
jgi:hypothetical protein